MTANGSTARILIVEDEHKLAQILDEYLVMAGFRCEQMHTGSGVIERARTSPPALILLDLMLPGVDGLTICREIRAFSSVPIIMVTARVEEIDRLLGLELGADDYVTKPFSLRELLARVKAVLRRVEDASPSTQNQITIGNLVVDFSTYDAFVAGKPEPMSHKEFEILKFLWQHQGQTVSRDQLLNDVWGYDQFPTTRTVDNFMLKLRKRIENDPAHPRHILTVHGIGYKLLT